MKSTKMSIVALSTVMALAGVILYVDDVAVSGQLSNSDMARMLGKGCRTYPTGFGCTGEGSSCGNKCTTCKSYTIGGTDGEYCDYDGPPNDRTCTFDTWVTCQTNMWCSMDPQDNEECKAGNEYCQTEMGKSCPQCGYVGKGELQYPINHCE